MNCPLFVIPDRSIPDDVLYAIVGQSDVLTLLCWRRTSRWIFRQVAILLRRRYEDCVRAFVPDVPHLDALMRDAGAIISGSTALHFFLEDGAQAIWTYT